MKGAAPFVLLAVTVTVTGAVVSFGLYLRTKLRAGEAKADFWSSMTDKGISLLQKGGSMLAGA